MAQAGSSYEAILKHYYSGVALTPARELRLEIRAAPFAPDSMSSHCPETPRAVRRARRPARHARAARPARAAARAAGRRGHRDPVARRRAARARRSTSRAGASCSRRATWPNDRLGEVLLREGKITRRAERGVGPRARAGPAAGPGARRGRRADARRAVERRADAGARDRVQRLPVGRGRVPLRGVRAAGEGAHHGRPRRDRADPRGRAARRPDRPRSARATPTSHLVLERARAAARPACTRGSSTCSRSSTASAACSRSATRARWARARR